VIDSVADGDGATTASQDVGDLVCTLPLELEVDAARTARLRDVSARGVGRGTLLTRALLLATDPSQAPAPDPSQAPARIELVSRPFMIFGRHSSTAGTGFGDFTLGFVPKYTRISRLHCVICALGDQLALMPASDVGRTYTGRNGRRLARGSWELLEADDVLEICDLYRLKLVLAWEPVKAGFGLGAQVGASSGGLGCATTSGKVWPLSARFGGRVTPARSASRCRRLAQDSAPALSEFAPRSGSGIAIERCR